MFALIFQITIYARTNEHSERAPYCAIVGEDVKIYAERTNKRATWDGWKCFCDIYQNVISAALAKSAALVESKGGGVGGKMLSDSRKVPANTSLTNGLHQAGFDFFLMALM